MDANELQGIAKREHARIKPVIIRCCSATGCLSCGAMEIQNRLRVLCIDHPEIQIETVGCMLLCGRGPLVEVSGTLYEQVNIEQASAIIAGDQSKQLKVCDLSHPFFSKQFPIVLENSGKINPERIESYIAVGGYTQLLHVLTAMHPQNVIEMINISGLRGRGGAGYPTGLKWSTVAKMSSKQKYVICNADEGDPGAFMDRAVLESDPHRVLEGMTIAGYAVGANHGYIYVRAEYPLAIERIQKAIEQSRQYELSGNGIFGSGFDFKIEIRIGAGAFVCGEETALIQSIQGSRGTPSPRPPYPAESGLWGCPTLINNVETFANIVPILRQGGDWYANIGTAKSKGTKVFALSGNVANAGLVEVPMGTTLRHVVEEMGEGIEVKAIQTGGPSGGCVPAELLDTPIDYESLQRIGTIIGSGGMIVIGKQASMVEMAYFYMQFSREESCGKCIPCRAGTVQLELVLSRILEGRATMAQLEQIKQLSYMVKEMSLCGLGQTAPNPLLSSLKYFENEYLELLQKEENISCQ